MTRYLELDRGKPDEARPDWFCFPCSGRVSRAEEVASSRSEDALDRGARLHLNWRGGEMIGVACTRWNPERIAVEDDDEDDDEQVPLDPERVAELHRLMALLSDETREILRLHMDGTMSQWDIARTYGLVQASVHTRIKTTLAKLARFVALPPVTRPQILAALVCVPGLPTDFIEPIADVLLDHVAVTHVAARIGATQGKVRWWMIRARDHLAGTDVGLLLHEATTKGHSWVLDRKPGKRGG